MNSDEVLCEEDVAAWLRLLMTPGVGGVTRRQLLRIWSWPTDIFATSLSEKRQHVDETLALRLQHPPEHWQETTARTLDWLRAPNCHMIPLGSPHYPASLLQIPDPPVCLFAQGHLPALTQLPWLAMVGSRNPTPQGVSNARAFARVFAEQGLGVVSGLALGIDGAAHEGALAGSGPTMAVVGTGLDRVYPKAHHALAHKIAESGLLLSEYVLGTPPLAAHFPQRNRLISGLSAGVLVVEATLQSGSLITARLAGDQGREVFAIPGSIHSPQSKGCHTLIRQGAKLVDSAQDVLDELQIQTPAAQQEVARSDKATPQASALVQALGYEVVDLDTLLARTGMTAQELQVALMGLELEGHVQRLAGARWQRVI